VIASMLRTHYQVTQSSSQVSGMNLAHSK